LAGGEILRSVLRPSLSLMMVAPRGRGVLKSAVDGSLRVCQLSSCLALNIGALPPSPARRLACPPESPPQGAD
jgi:hypothetical protein